MEINELLEFSVNRKASDLHLIVGLPPMVRINGVLAPIPGKDILNDQVIQSLVFNLVTEDQKEVLLVNKELDFSFPWKDAVKKTVIAYVYTYINSLHIS